MNYYKVEHNKAAGRFRKAIILIFVSFSVTSMAQVPGYYNGTEGKSGNELKTALHEIINQHVDFSYSDAKYILNYADEDPDIPGNVILFYTKRSQGNDTWGSGGNYINREHVWAKSHGDFEDIRPMDGDAFNLHPADASVNITKSNYDFDECSATGTLIPEADAYYTSSQFEPKDEAKGEVARTIFYMAVRYEGTDGELDLEAVDAVNTSAKAEHGKLSTLLQWNNDFPPTDLERRRNERVFESQRNRNPFIDNPNFANLIWNSATPSGISIGMVGMADDYPLAGTSTTISATITGNSSAILSYGLDWDSKDNTTIMAQSGDNWTGSFDLSGFLPGDLVHYKIVAGDGSTTESVRGTYSIPTILTLTDIRNIQGTGNNSPLLNSSVSIGGIITANFDNTYYIQNGTDLRDGIAVYGVQRGRVGDSIVVTGKVSEYETLTELYNVSYTYVFEKDSPIVPPVISIDDVSEDYEGMIVSFSNVTFLDGDTEIPFNSFEYKFTDGSNTMTAFSRFDSRMAGEIIPAGTVNVTGIVSQYQGNYQLLIHSIDYIKVGEDNDPPLLTGITVSDGNWIEVNFSEKLEKTSAELISNYSIDGGVSISGAYLYNDTKVLLLVSGLMEQNYTLTVSNISDLQGNVITEATLDFHSDFTGIVASILKNKEMVLYPNPVIEVLNIDFPDQATPETIQVYDIKGRLIRTYQPEVFSDHLKIDVSFLNSGVYIVKCNAKDIVIQDIFSIAR